MCGPPIERAGPFRPQPRHHPRAAEGHEGDLAYDPRLEAHRGAGRDVEAMAPSGVAVEGERRVRGGEVVVAAYLDGPVTRVLHAQREGGPPLVDGHRALAVEGLPRDHGI